MAALHLIKDKKGKIGYEQTDTHEIVIAPQFDEGMETFGRDSYIESPYASVRLGSKYGIVNESGEIVVPIEYDEAYYLFDYLFAVRKRSDQRDWAFGVINQEGKCIIPFEYKYIEKSNSFIVCYQNATSKRKFERHGWGDEHLYYGGRVYDYKDLSGIFWMNAQGQTIYEGNAIQSAFHFLIIEDSGKLGVIDTNGNIVLTTAFDEIHCPCVNRFIVRKNISEDEWTFGVVDEKQTPIIDFCYKYIESENCSFYQCWEKCESHILNGKSPNANYEYLDKKSCIWLNRDGKKILSGDATILSDEFLCVENNGKKGVYSQDGRRIVNYIYDQIREVDGKLAVSKDGKVGVLGENGEIVIDSSYKRIECVHITNRQYGGVFEPITYGYYSLGHPFDTSSKDSEFFKREIKKDWTLKVNAHFFFEQNTVFILEQGNYSELFTLIDGILSNSKFETISALTDISFVVKNKGKWGVYRADKMQLAIPCEYDRIIFEGNNTVLLNKEGLWGAKMIILKLLGVNIPVKFFEIQTLSQKEKLFSVKCSQENYKGETYFDYTIVDECGEEPYKMHSLHGKAHFKFYSIERVLSFDGEKYGFINMYGYTSIPFKYDKVEEREDGLFDVCINEAWGVLDISGKEIVKVKYAEKIPIDFDKHIVKELSTGCLGILDELGNEYVPTIYEHLMFADEKDSDFVFFGFHGYEDDESNFFSGKISNGVWGCLNSRGERIIDAKYDCFKIQDGFILGGRDGRMLGEGQHGHTYYENEYGGVYDLYDFSGHLIIGGFTSFYDFDDLYVFQFGGHWKEDCETEDEWGNYIYDYYYSYHFEKSNSRWLVLDKGLRSVMKTKKGERHQFREGFLGTITKKEEDGKIVNYWNMPLELFSIKEPSFSHNLMICGEDYFEWVVRITDGLASHKHNQIHVIDENLFFFMDEYDMGSGVGIAKLDTDDNGKGEATLIDPIVEGTCVLTYPIGGYVFGVWNFEDDKYMVKLYNILKPDIAPIIAIKCIEEEDLMKKISRGYFMITLNEESEGYSRIMLPIHEIFDEEFLMLISQKETGEIFPPFEECYWYTDGQHLIKPNDDDDYNDGGYRDDSDYMRDSWDAMTDGMYGDMPDGFDGDYDFLGR